MKAKFDHVVIGTTDLAGGTDWVEARLGAATGGGGAHPLMATHNRLMRLGGQETELKETELQETELLGGYLEVIAADPAAPPPSRRRWYMLDEQHTTDHLSSRPRALCWVASVSDIESAVRDCGYDAGAIIEVTRGDLHWRLTVPEDGGLAAHGILPALIEWPAGIDPVAALPVANIALAGIVATHPDPDFINDCMDRLGLSRMISLASGPPRIAFDFQTETGIVRID